MLCFIPAYTQLLHEGCIFERIFICSDGVLIPGFAMTEFPDYHYVGTSEILAALPEESSRVCIRSAGDVLVWIHETEQPQEADGTVISTFIIDTAGQLWINDRRSEHVLCAAGGNVLSAGEITFDATSATVTAITNQSTGYCPEPASWSAVQKALNHAAILHPGDFTTSYIFRKCASCGTKNIIKDDWFYCGVCDAKLPETWNFDE